MITDNRVSWLLILLALAALLYDGTAARQETSGPYKAFARLQAAAANGLEAQWDEQTGVPRFISGRDPATALPYTPTAAERRNPTALARGFLDENRALFKMTSATEQLSVLRVEEDMQLGYSHVRLNELYKGLPVFGKQLVVHLDAQENIVAVNGQFAPDINVETQPSINPSQAEQVALDDLLEVQLEPDERSRVNTEILSGKTTLMVYVDQSNKATLTWNVTIMSDSPLGQWVYFVNARRPAIVHQFDEGEHIKQRRTFSADNRAAVPGRILVDEGERANNDQVAQAAHDGAGKVYDYYFNTFKRDAIDGRGSPMISTVHYGSDPQDAENAAWIGERQQMIYGDGGQIFRPLSLGLDVVGHEFTHGITDGTAGLIYQGQSGALNESYSDIFATMIDRANWTLGEQIVKSPPFPAPVLRDLQDPSLGGRYSPSNPLSGVGQPTTMRQYANLQLSRRSDNGGVHINSGIPNHAAFLVAQALGREKTEQIYYRTLTQYLTPDANFQDAAKATVRSAQELYGTNEANAVSDAFNQVGINISGASSVPPPPSSQPKTGPAAPPPPPPSTAAGCTNLIVNGTFENAEAGWTQVSTAHSSIIDTELPHTGTRSAWLGGTDTEPVQYIYQDVRLPANATSVKLAYWRFIHPETKGILGLLANDATFSTLIADTNGTILATAEQFASSEGDDTWKQAQVDLSQLAGKAIRLVFGAENPRNNVSSYFIDDVEVTACTSGAAPSAPQSTSADQVYIQGTIKNADTGRGVEGAQFYVIKPGLSATQASSDDKITKDEVVTYGTSDANGVFQTLAPVPRGKTYSVVVLGRGFRPIIADDGMQLPANAGNPFTTNATLRANR